MLEPTINNVGEAALGADTKTDKCCGRASDLATEKTGGGLMPEWRAKYFSNTSSLPGPQDHHEN